VKRLYSFFLVLLFVSSGLWAQTNIQLTPEELDYLNRKGEVSFCIDPHWLPFEAVDENEVQGMTSDFIKLFEEKLHIPFVFVPTGTWGESQMLVREGKVDLLPLVSENEERLTYINFTKPYLRYTVAIFTREDEPFISNLNQLRDKKIGIVENNSIWIYVGQNYPGISFLNVENVQDGLLSVSSGEIDAYLEALPVASYHIRLIGLTNLKVAGHLQIQKELRIGVSKNSAELKPIMDKLIWSLSPEEINDIYETWISLRYEKHVDYSLLWKIALGIGVIAIFIILWIRKLSLLNKKLSEAHNELTVKNEELLQISIIDRLTRIFNRMKLEDALAEEIERGERYGRVFSVIIIDIDHFKSVNDTFGHNVGDTVLKEFSKILMENIRKTDTLGRWGGEEFLIVCPETMLDNARLLAENLREKVSVFTFTEVKNKTGSFGVAQYKKGETLEQLVARADEALYKAKTGGRNRVMINQ
jgi:polar amino acid transport system substrate-binding protein